MQKDNSVQLEIFSFDDAQTKTQAQRRSFLNYIWGYEKTILAIIALLAVAVISFSLGVEKGKKIISLKSPFLTNTINTGTQRIEKLPVLPKKEVTNKGLPEKRTLPAPAVKEYQENFTIQVASYRSKTSVQKEAQLLKNKGFQPSVVPDGNYIRLYVGKFFSREQALASLKELKKRYQDCFIRRL
jgi:hypothetical protein